MRTLRRWALPLVPLYRLGLAIKDRLRSTPKKLTHPVISIGSLSAGGAGKTPIVIALANLLSERGWSIDILSRGYGRTSTGVLRVDPTLPTAATTFGDEPTLIATRTNAPVWVASDRFEAGKAAEQSLATATKPVHLLDDGFQHRQLHRDIDIVLVTAEDLADTLLPAGNRREPLSALHRADIVILREEELPRIEATLKPLLRPNTLLWTARRSLSFPAPLFVFGAGLRPIAFCAIARPEGFAKLLIDSGCGIVETVFFPDHHRFDADDIAHILRIATGLKASGFVTTEKDAVKLTPALRAQLEDFGPLMVATLDAELLFPERIARELESRLYPVTTEDPA